MNIGHQLLFTRDSLAAWAKGNNAPVKIAGDLNDLITLLQEAPAAPRVVVMFHREAKRGVHEEAGMVDRFFWVTIARAKGLKIEPGANLVNGGTAGSKPLFLLADEARQIIRNLQFSAASTEVTPNFISMEPLAINGVMATDALRLEFSVGTLLAAVAVADPTNPLNLTA